MEHCRRSAPSFLPSRFNAPSFGQFLDLDAGGQVKIIKSKMKEEPIKSKMKEIMDKLYERGFAQIKKGDDPFFNQSTTGFHTKHWFEGTKVDVNTRLFSRNVKIRPIGQNCPLLTTFNTVSI